MLVVTLPDNFYDDEKTIRAGTLAVGLFTKALSYSITHGTKGFIHDKILACLIQDAGDYIGCAMPEVYVASLLLEVGLLESMEQGFVIANFDRYCWDDERENYGVA